MLFLRPLVSCALCVALAAVSCFSPDPPQSTPLALLPAGVSPQSLWRTPEVWRDKPVRCILVADSYTTDHDFLFWYDGRPGAMPAVVFECDKFTPQSSSVAIEIVGTCRGRKDGRVLVSGCVVTVIHTRLP